MKMKSLPALTRFYPFLENFVRRELGNSPEQFAGGEMLNLEVESHEDIRSFVVKERPYCSHAFYIDKEGMILADVPFNQGIQPPPGGLFVHSWQERVAYVVFLHSGTSEGEGEDAYLQVYEVRRPIQSTTAR